MTQPGASSVRTGKKFNTNCCVFGCFSKKQNNRSVHFHYIPKANSGVVKITNDLGEIVVIDRRTAWENVLLLGKPITNHMRVCSKHFQASDYCSDVQLKQPKLKKTAIPSLNLPDREQYKHVIKSFPLNESLSERNVDIIGNGDHNLDPENVNENSFVYSSSNDSESDTDDMDAELADADFLLVVQPKLEETALPLLSLPDDKQ